MEIRAFARQILATESLAEKLARGPAHLSDQHPGPAERWSSPARAPHLRFAPRGQRTKIPAISALRDPIFRARTLHHFANHELMAVELMAFALLAWPEMPPSFRRGLLATLRDEQLHCGLYLNRMAALGLEFGDLPLNDHFWRTEPDLQSPLAFVATMALTFENGNLDHALRYHRAFEALGDLESARIMLRVYEDELRHVRFGLKWLRKLKDPAETDWEAYTRALASPTSPSRAKGPEFDLESRRKVGLDEDFICHLRDYVPPSTAALAAGRPLPDQEPVLPSGGLP